MGHPSPDLACIPRHSPDGHARIQITPPSCLSCMRTQNGINSRESPGALGKHWPHRHPYRLSHLGCRPEVQGILSAAQLSPQFMLFRLLCKLLHAAEGLLGGLFHEERLRKQLF